MLQKFRNNGDGDDDDDTSTFGILSDNFLIECLFRKGPDVDDT